MSDEKYIKRQVRSRPGLTQDEALRSLQSHPDFKAGTKIDDFQKSGSRFVATLLEPKEAEFPPKKKDDEEDESDSPLEKAVEGELKEGPPSDSGDSDDSDSDSDSDSSDSGPPSDAENGGPPKKPGDEKPNEGVELGEILNLLHKITDALGLDKPEDSLMGGPEGGPPPPGPKGGPPPGAGGPPGAGPAGPGKVRPRPALRPGMAPPGTTPVGAPAFSSVQEMSKHIPSFTATTDEPLSVKEAKEDLEATYDPYKVKQIRRKEGKLLSVR
jgi:hypothetical protein